MSEATLTASRKRKRVSSFEKETFVFEQDDDGEEVTITASKNWIKKFHKNHKEATIEAYKKELAREIVKKEYQCFSCKIFPRPGIKFLKKCKYCFKIFCHDCVTVKHVGCPSKCIQILDISDLCKNYTSLRWNFFYAKGFLLKSRCQNYLVLEKYPCCSLELESRPGT